jgi:predicted alpha/beta superfamily hydrolase
MPDGRLSVVRVRYPLEHGRIVLRTDRDWGRDIEPIAVADDRQTFVFELALGEPYTYFKPCLHDGDGLRWGIGNNYLLVAGSGREIYPAFYLDSGCRVGGVEQLRSARTSAVVSYRIFQPPGYGENTLKRYPVVYMQDGQNLFFHEEAFRGNHWRLGETLTLLLAMNAIDKILVVGIYPQHREDDYSLPGYRTFGALIAEELKPAIDDAHRTLPGPASTAVMGASLGGIFSFYLAWEHPQLFGMAACMSSPFGARDDLRHRVAAEEPRDVRFYLDSGWPADNYEVTRAMRDLLVQRGYGQRRDLVYLAFPQNLHNEHFWALRSHIPLQFFFRNGPMGGGTG